MKRILLIEDDQELGAQVLSSLEETSLEGGPFSVRWLRDGDEALRLDPGQYDLVLLDLNLPGAYGMDILKAFREKSETPILLVTARQHTADKVRGLSLGADDYITKPFWPEELLARVKANLRRPSMRKGKEERYVFGAITIDVGARQVISGGEDVHLSPVEFDVLRVLCERADQAISRVELAESALDMGDERTLDVHISRLRKKLGTQGKRVQTVWGIGYRFSSQAETSK